MQTELVDRARRGDREAFSVLVAGIERGLLHLTEAQRTILVLTFYAGLSPTGAAAVLEIPVGTGWQGDCGHRPRRADALAGTGDRSRSDPVAVTLDVAVARYSATGFDPAVRLAVPQGPAGS